jgi:error-prone DNA polymerase
LSARYAELRCKSNFSFLEGASHPEELVDRAADLGLEALALTDRNGLYGVVRAHARARKRGLPLIVGVEMTCDGLGPGGTASLLLLAVDREGYAHLCRLVTEAHRGEPIEVTGAVDAVARKPEARIPFLLVAEQTRGLVALYPGADAGSAARLREAFGHRLALAVSRHRAAGEETRIAAARSVGRRLGIPVAVVNDVHTHDRRRQPLQDVLTCVRLGTTVERVGRRLFPNAERTLQGPEEMAQLWRDFPEGLDVAVALAAQCRFRLEEIRGEHPLPPVLSEAAAAAPAVEDEPISGSGRGIGGMALLRALVRGGARWRYGGPPPEEVERQLARELDLVEQLEYASYFLTVWDIVRFARSRGILCQGRGSAANSAICYVLGITSIDPVRMGLLFERFLSAERGDPPDIDVDF